MPSDIKYTSDSDLESVISFNEPTTTESPRFQYVCNFKGCDERFRRMVHLDRHEFKHTGVRKYACHYTGCTKSYTIITHLKRHIRISHEQANQVKERNVKCRFESCKKLFVSSYNMERHVREVHNNPKTYSCSHCKEIFTQKLKLRRHEIKHTAVYPYNCNKCSKGFLFKNFLERHVCKTYPCTQCESVFEKWSQLMAHYKETKHNKTVHKCVQCDKVFASKFSLTEHEGMHENNVYKCPKEGCDRIYYYSKNLTRHIQTFHEGKQYPCTVEGCTAKLSSKRCLANHIQKVHQNPRKKIVNEHKKKRAQRKDAGQRKTSALSKMSGVVLDPEVDKMIAQGSATIEIDVQEVEKQIQMLCDTPRGEGVEETLVLVTTKIDH